VGYGQFHSGYIDFLVRGGVIGALILTCFLATIFVRLLKTLQHNKESSAMLLILFIGILIHNYTEASLMQFPNTLWVLMLCIHFHARGISTSSIRLQLSKASALSMDQTVVSDLTA
jgi:O-antigen ligase